MHRRTGFARGAFALLVALAAPCPAPASPARFVPVGDPIEAELRVLELYAPGAPDSLRARAAIPHLGSGPWQVRELAGPLGFRQGPGGPAPGGQLAGPRSFAALRVARELARDLDGWAGPVAPGATPRAFARSFPGDERVELSAGLEGTWDATRVGGTTDSRWADGSGVHVRMGLQVDRWFAYSHLFFGELRGVRAFSDALVANTDVAASTEESYLAYSAGTQWSAQLGRGRWHWGPGEEGSLLLSRTMAPVNGLMLHLRVEPLRADAFAFAATVDPGTGEQLAAHRIEWQPRDGLRVGVAEAARYRAGGWQGAYLAGVIPYAVVQRLLDQEHADSLGTLKNNVMVALDAAWRVADGSKVYGELLLDDLHARSARFPNKYGWQAGWSGTGEVRGTRLDWNTEYTWLSRYVYTSYFGRAYTAQGRPLGFPTGPGSRRMRARVTWNPRLDWQLGAIAARTEQGSEGLGDAFVPFTPVPDVTSLAGVVQRSRTLEAELRWWPASGVDLAVRAGREWIENAAHVAGASRPAWRGSVALRLDR